MYWDTTSRPRGEGGVLGTHCNLREGKQTFFSPEQRTKNCTNTDSWKQGCLLPFPDKDDYCLGKRLDPVTQAWTYFRDPVSKAVQHLTARKRRSLASTMRQIINSSRASAISAMSHGKLTLCFPEVPMGFQGERLSHTDTHSLETKAAAEGQPQSHNSLAGRSLAGTTATAFLLADLLT